MGGGCGEVHNLQKFHLVIEAAIFTQSGKKKDN